MSHRFLAILAILLFFVALPASAEPTSESPSTELRLAEFVTATDTATDVDTVTVADSEIADATEPAFDLLEFLDLTSPVLETGYNPYPGYCYHDCSTCYSRDDCIEPGFTIGFPCTEIPLC